ANYIRDFSGRQAVSKIDEQNLRGIAHDMRVDYVHRNAAGNLAEAVAPENIKLIKLKSKEKVSFELYWVIGLIVFCLSLWELWRSSDAIMDILMMRKNS